MKKYLTLMIIPHNESHVREFHLSRPVIWGVLGLLGTFFCTLGFFAFGYFFLLHKESSLADMQTENAELKRQFVFLQEKLDNVRHQIDLLTEKDRMMRAMVDLPEPGAEVREMGVGGGEEGTPEWNGLVSLDEGNTLTETYTNMDQLLREARFLKASFDTIGARLSRDEKLRDHLPSIMPVQGQYWLSSPFGYRRDPFTGQKEFHNGLDLAGWPGTPIVAPASAVVERVGFDKRLGYFIKLDHGNGYETIYGHLQQRPSLQEGQKVNRGDKIGQMGDTGRSTATHVHYMIEKNGRAIDPQKFIFDDATTLAKY